MKTVDEKAAEKQPDSEAERAQVARQEAIWIIYPAIAWVVLTATHAWFVYMRRPIPEREIEREMERQAGGPSDG